MAGRSGIKEKARKAEQTVSSKASAGPDGIALSPPTYPIDVVDSAPGEAMRANLRILRGVPASRVKALNPPTMNTPSPTRCEAQTAKPISDTGLERPSSDFYRFRGVLMTTDPLFMKGELRRLIRRHGLRGGNQWYEALQGRGFDLPVPFLAHVRPYRPWDVGSEVLDSKRAMPEEQQKNRLAPVAVPLALELYPEIRKEAFDYLEAFRNCMVLTLETVLGESERRLETERIRYGLLKKGDGPVATYEAKDTVTFKGLVGAAQDLLEIRTRINNLWIQQGGLRVSRGKAGFVIPETNRTKYEELGRQIALLEQEYGHARMDASLRYPSLGAILDDAGTGNEEEHLRSVARGELKSGLRGRFAVPGAPDLIGRILDSRQASIDKVREKVDDDPEKLWSIGSIVQLTRVSMDTKSKTMAEKLIDDKLAEASDEEIMNLFLGIVALALAIPTGGSSLAVGAAVVGAGISGYQAFQSIQKYQFEMALANTDLDKRAAALAADEPSAFWVALDVVFVIADGTAALNAFRAVKSKALAALLAEGADAVEAETRLVKAADAAEGVQESQLGKRLRSTLAQLRGRSRQARAFGGAGAAEAAAVTHATEAIAKEAKSAETLVTIGAHEVKATKSGHLVICTECTWLRERFARELAEKPELLARIQAAEDKVKLAGTAVDAPTKAEIVALSQELHSLQKARLLAELGSAGVTALKIDQIKKLFPKLEHLDAEALQRVLALAPNEGSIKGQLLEELFNARMAKPEALEPYVPVSVAKQLQKEGRQLQFIPGHAIRDAEGELISDGLIGYWKDDRFHVITFFESKAGRASGRGLRRKWTGIPKAERAEIMKEAQAKGIAAFREIDQDAAEALSEAVASVKRSNKQAAALTTDEVLRQFPSDVEKAWAKLPQSEAGQIRKTTERLVPGVDQAATKLKFDGIPVEVTTAGRTPHAVGVLPSDVAEQSLAQIMKEGGIKSFERMQDVALNQAELNQMADQIAKLQD